MYVIKFIPSGFVHDKKIKCDHMGKRMLSCIVSQSHLEQAKALKAQQKLPFQGAGAQSIEELNWIETELQMAVLTVISNVPLAFYDHSSPTIRKVFPDSEIAFN